MIQICYEILFALKSDNQVLIILNPPSVTAYKNKLNEMIADFPLIYIVHVCLHLYSIVHGKEFIIKKHRM